MQVGDVLCVESVMVLSAAPKWISELLDRCISSVDQLEPKQLGNGRLRADTSVWGCGIVIRRSRNICSLCSVESSRSFLANY